MKRQILIILLMIQAGFVFAQSEVPSDSIRINTGNYVNFGDFVIDMNELLAPQLPEITHEYLLGPDVTKDFNSMFRLDNNLVYSREYVPRSYFSTSTPFGFHSGSEQFQTSTFKLNSGRLTLYGEYNSEGYRVPNRGGFPWDKNRFVGGMSFKSDNGFSFKVEIRRERNPYFPY